MQNNPYIVLAAIAVTIFYGYRTRRNIAPLAITFAWIIGCGILKIPAKKLLGYIPLSVLFQIFAATFFFGFAIENGTLALLTEKILHAVRRSPALTLPAFFAASFLVAMSGAGITTSAFMAPLVFSLTEKMQLHPVVAYAATICGTTAGSNFMYSGGGVVLLGMVESSGCDASPFKIGCVEFLISFLLCLGLFLAVYLYLGGYRCDGEAAAGEAGKMNDKQRRTYFLMITVALLMVIPKLAAEISDSVLLKEVSEFLDLGMIMTCGGCVASVMGLGDDRDVIRKQVPWTTIVMLGGMSMLIGVGKESGLIEEITSIITDHMPTAAIAAFLAGTAGLMSVFSSAIGVVLPTLFPMVPQLSAATGVSASLMFIAIFVGATMTGISPLSTNGSMVLAGCRSESKRNSLFYQVIGLPFMMLIAVAVVCFLLQMTVYAAN